jgi:hypothetical protein
MDEEDFADALCFKIYAFDDEGLPETAFPLSMHFLEKHNQQMLQSLKKEQKPNLFIPSNPLLGQVKQDNSFAIMAKLWFPKNYNQESSNGIMITLDIPVSIKPKKPLVITFGGQK